MLVTIGTQRVKSTCLIQTPIDVDNGHLFLAQSTDSHRKSTSLMYTLHYVLLAVTDLSFCQCSKCYSTLHRMICKHQFQTILASNELCRDCTVLIK